MKLREVIGVDEDRNKYQKGEGLVSDSCIGIELEWEGLSRYDIVTCTSYDNFFWNIIEDHSLRNGIELVLAKPMKEANLTHSISNIDNIINELSQISKAPLFSHRTSMHVHLDVRDLELEEINKLILLYLLFEGVLFNYVGYYRIKNNYCRPLIGSNFNKILSSMRQSEMRPNNYMSFISEQCDKYSALNVKSVSKFGSIEFRHHPGEYNGGKIKDWVNIILSLKKYITDGNTVLDVLSLSPSDAINAVFYNTSHLLNNNINHLLNNNKMAVLEYINLSNLSDRTSDLLLKRKRPKKENKLINHYDDKSGEA